MSVTHSASDSIQQFGKLWPQCVARAWQDAQFREALKRDPVGTIQSSFEFVFPKGVSIEIIEGSEPQQSAAADTLRLVIPPAPAVNLREIAITNVEQGMKDASNNAPVTFCTC